MEEIVESVEYKGHWKDEAIPADEIDVGFTSGDHEYSLHITGLGEEGGLVEIELSGAAAKTVTLLQLHQALSRMLGEP